MRACSRRCGSALGRRPGDRGPRRVDGRSGPRPRRSSSASPSSSRPAGPPVAPSASRSRADAVLASAAAAESALGGPGQWLLALPTHYIAGLNVLVRSIAGGTEPVRRRDEHFDRRGVRRRCRSDRLDGAALHLARARAARRACSTPRRRARPMPPPLRPHPGRRAGDPGRPARPRRSSSVCVTRTYGSSETSGGCVYDGVPLGDTPACASTTAGRARRPDARRGLPRRSRPHRRRVPRPTTATAGTAPTTAACSTTACCAITGRVDDVIVSGGVKVSLGEVEVVVRSHPGSGCRGRRVRAERVGRVAGRRHRGGIHLEALRDVVAAQLGAEARPARVLLVDSIPTTSTGKPDRVAVAALALK